MLTRLLDNWATRRLQNNRKRFQNDGTLQASHPVRPAHQEVPNHADAVFRVFSAGNGALVGLTVLRPDTMHVGYSETRYTHVVTAEEMLDIGNIMTGLYVKSKVNAR